MYRDHVYRLLRILFSVALAKNLKPGGSGEEALLTTQRLYISKSFLELN